MRTGGATGKTTAQKKRMMTMPKKRMGANGAGRRRTLVGRTRRSRQGVMTSIPLRTETLNGLQWAVAALHPCNEGSVGVVGLPDDVQLETHCMRTQRTVTISPPGQSCGGKTEVCSWSLTVVTTPWPEYPFLVCACKGNDEPMPLSAYIKAGYHFINMDCMDAPNNWGWWHYYSYPVFQTGSCKGVDPPSKDLNDLRTKYQKLRVVGKGTTAYLNASRLDDGGRVICGQYPAAARYLDTFQPNAYDLPMDEIVAHVKKTLNLGAVEEHTHTVTLDATHGHGVYQSYVLDHRHPFPHSHSGDAASHTHSTDLSHKHKLPHLSSTQRVQEDGVEAFTEEALDAVKNVGAATSHTGGLQFVTKIGEVQGAPTVSSAIASKPTPYTGFGTTLNEEKDDDGIIPVNKVSLVLGPVQTGPPLVDPGAPEGDPLVRDIQGIKLKPSKDEENTPNWFVSEPPVTENSLFYGDPKATTWPARKGAYQVLRLENMEMQDVHTGALSFYDLGDSNKQEVTPENFLKSMSANVEGCGTWGVMVFKNISMNTSVTLKSVQYTQGVANPKGPYAHSNPMRIDPDPMALELVTKESNRLAHAYYSEYNDLGKILGEIFKVAKNVGGTVKAVSNSLTGVPVIGDIASTISNVLGSIGL